MIEMKSWILFFFIILFVMNLFFWLDYGLHLQLFSIIYLNGTLLICFLLFFIWRYQKEMSFTRGLTSLLEQNVDDWLEGLPRTVFYREEITRAAIERIHQEKIQELSSLRNRITIEGDYIASWVHEVKTPLTSMKLTIDANRHDPVMKKLDADWIRIHLLIDQQLSIARLPSLETDFTLEKVIPQQLVKEELRELMSLCMQKNIAFEISEEAVTVLTDRKWCRFIIRQIITNAVKYSASDATIHVTTGNNETGHFTMTIVDEGPGIPAHDLPRIFEKGFTGGTGRINNAATGLGLYLAKTVALKIGIVLQVQSEVGQGTAITLIFSKENEFETILHH